jgi:hypothetical protein
MTHALDLLLDRTRDALLTGNFPELARLAPELEGEVAQLRRQDSATVARLLRKAERNATLLTAARRGVKAALGRLDEIVAGPTLTTYDASGRKAEFPACSTSPVRRA